MKSISIILLVVGVVFFTSCSIPNDDSNKVNSSDSSEIIPVKVRERDDNVSKEALITMSKEESGQYLQFINETWDKMQSYSSEKVWRNYNAIGTPIDSALKLIGNTRYEFFVLIPNENKESKLFFRSTSQDYGFPRERIIFTYDHNTELGTIEHRFYTKAGLGTLLTDKNRAIKRLNECIKLVPKMFQ